MPHRRTSRPITRAEQALLDVLPLQVRKQAATDAGSDFVIAEQPVTVKWAGEGDLGDVRRLFADRPPRNVVVAGQRLSPGARDFLRQAGVSWVDETGAAEVVLGTIIVSRTGQAPTSPTRPARWTPATLAVAESILCGAEATVSATQQATGLSTGSCTTALRTLTELELLDADAARGPAAGRKVPDERKLLTAYAAAADALRPRESLQLGVTWRDPVAGLIDLGRAWSRDDLEWCASGAVAAAVIAPHLTTIGATEVYVQVDTLAGLDALAGQAHLRPIEGGRLTLRPMPTQGVRRLTTVVGGLHVAPWPRVFADLRTIGVRGEEAAEHLLEVIHARRG